MLPGNALVTTGGPGYQEGASELPDNRLVTWGCHGTIKGHLMLPGTLLTGACPCSPSIQASGQGCFQASSVPPGLGERWEKRMPVSGGEQDLPGVGQP